ncbi:serine hydrolase domain-containing protein [Cohnella sp.]|uniref:serine hydrolase domain-containing protein n=1 Tax=Cohnella sp. TaxID=1883426 RepID=UPI003568DE67
MDDYLKSRDFNGSVLIGRKGQELLTKGYGLANFEHEVLNTPSTKYRVGSISKQFTAASILLLEERELLHVKDTIAKYIPNFPNGDAITLHHLITHSSGLPNFNRLPDFSDIKGIYSSLISTIDRFKYLPLEFSAKFRS